MPESSPVASGCRRSCSMMNRSIVTTEVAVCWTTGLPLHGGWSAGHSARGVPPRVRLVGIPGVAVPQSPPQIAERKGTIATKLMDVAEFVQEQFRTERDPLGHPNRAPQGDPAHRSAPQTPASDAQRESAAPPPRLAELRVGREQLGRKGERRSKEPM